MKALQLTAAAAAQAITRIETAQAGGQFKEGNLRSLANMLTAVLGSSELGWATARAIKEANPDFTAEQALASLRPEPITEKRAVAGVAPQTAKHENGPAPVVAQQAVTAEAKATAEQLPYGQLQAGETANDRIRARFAAGAGPSAIAKELGLTVRRVKNVRKYDERKALAASQEKSLAALRKELALQNKGRVN